MAANPVAPAAWVDDCSRKKVSVLLPIWSSGTQLGNASGRAHIDTVNSSSMPAWMLSGRRTWLPVPDAPPGSDSPAPNWPVCVQEVVPVSVAAPTDGSLPVLAADVPCPSSKV